VLRKTVGLRELRWKLVVKHNEELHDLMDQWITEYMNTWKIE
jgi:hypothetical protein